MNTNRTLKFDSLTFRKTYYYYLKLTNYVKLRFFNVLSKKTNKQVLKHTVK